MTRRPSDGSAATAQWLQVLRSEVRARLKKQHATQISLAKYLGISPKHLSQILTGEVNCSPGVFTRMAEAMGLQIVIVDAGMEPVKLAEDQRKYKSGRPSRIEATNDREQ
jgi:transcriptional regulator with XRE-family HTH domain